MPHAIPASIKRKEDNTSKDFCRRISSSSFGSEPIRVIAEMSRLYRLRIKMYLSTLRLTPHFALTFQHFILFQSGRSSRLIPKRVGGMLARRDKYFLNGMKGIKNQLPKRSKNRRVWQNKKLPSSEVSSIFFLIYLTGFEPVTKRQHRSRRPTMHPPRVWLHHKRLHKPDRPYRPAWFVNVSRLVD